MFRICMTLLASVGLVWLPRAQSQVTLDQHAVLTDIRGSWKNWFDYRITGEVSIRVTNAGSAVVDPYDTEFVIIRSPDAMRACNRDRRKPGRESWYVVNPIQVFEVEARSKQSGYALKRIERRLDNLESQSQAIAGELSYREQFPAVYAFMSQRWDTVFNAKGFRPNSFKESKWQEYSAMEVTFHYDPHKNADNRPPRRRVTPTSYFELGNGRVLLLRDHSWAPIEWSFQVRSSLGEKEFTSIAATARYDLESEPYPLLVERIQNRTVQGATDVETTNCDYSELGRTTEPEEFQLAAFGFSENGAVLPKPRPRRWLWPLVGGALLMLLGGWYLRRV